MTVVRGVGKICLPQPVKPATNGARRTRLFRCFKRATRRRLLAVRQPCGRPTCGALHAARTASGRIARTQLALPLLDWRFWKPCASARLAASSSRGLGRPRGHSSVPAWWLVIRPPLRDAAGLNSRQPAARRRRHLRKPLSTAKPCASSRPASTSRIWSAPCYASGPSRAGHEKGCEASSLGGRSGAGR